MLTVAVKDGDGSLDSAISYGISGGIVRLVLKHQ